MNEPQFLQKHRNYFFYNYIFGALVTCMLFGIFLFQNYELKSLKNEIVNLQNINEHKVDYEKYNVLQKNFDELTELYNKEVENKIEVATQVLNYIEPLKETDKEQYYRIYRNLMEDDTLDSPETVYDYFTDEQITIMHRCIETETFGAPFEAKVNVASVILTRVEDDLFPTDPIEIITAPNQFAYSKRNISEDTILALEYAFIFGTEYKDCIAFRSDKKVEEWGNWIFTYEDGYHYFYSRKEGL